MIKLVIFPTTTTKGEGGHSNVEVKRVMTDNYLVEY